LVDAQLQIVLLNGQEHERNNTTRELIAGLFNKLSALLAGLMHVCGTGIRVVHASWLTKFLTLQTYNWYRSRKLGQILFLEGPFHLGVEAR